MEYGMNMVSRIDWSMICSLEDGPALHLFVLIQSSGGPKVPPTVPSTQKPYRT